jgi:hypothetical protein
MKPADVSGEKRRNILKTKLMSLQGTVQTTSESYRAINEFKRG